MNKPEITKGINLKFSEEVFIPRKTKTLIDSIASHPGGFMPAVTMMIAGGPGSGKSTLALNILSDLQVEEYKCLYVHGEMDEISHYKYCARMPKFKNIDVLFLKKHLDNPKGALESILYLDWDIVVLDSFAEIVRMVKTADSTTETEAESWLLAYEDKIKLEKKTTFINLQQVVKGGKFAGSQRVEHMMDSMAHIVYDEGSERYISFDKNRDGPTRNKIYINITNDTVSYSLPEVVPISRKHNRSPLFYIKGVI